jgi:dolichol-phosphate mannosyltransferase
MTQSKFSIIIPAYNEEGSIEKTLRELESKIKTPFEIIVVNDCSTDRTREIITGLNFSNLVLIDNPENLGFVGALSTGFEAATTEIILPVMADNCDKCSDIDKMYQLISDGFDIVSGSRYIKGGKRVSPLNIKSLCSKMVGLTIHLFTRIPTHDVSNSFKMFRKKILSDIKLESIGFEISMEITIKAYYIGYKITEIPTIWTDRVADQSKFKNVTQMPRYWKWMRFALLNKIKNCTH